MKTHEDPTFCYPAGAVDKHDPWQRLFFSHRFLPGCRSRFVALALVPAGIGNTIRARRTKTIKLDTKLRPQGNNFLCMIDTLMVELQCIGLQLHASKTKWFTTCDISDSCHVGVGGSFVEILHSKTVHKYSGRLLPGTLKTRTGTELTHCLQAAWAKFHKHKHVLANRHVSVKLRLKYFDANISPTLLFGLAFPL